MVETTRAACVLPGLVIEDTGSGEMSGTKYMKEAIGFPGNWSWPKSNRMVGPVAASAGGITDGGSVWPNTDSKPFDQSTSASSINLAQHRSSIDAVGVGENWLPLALIVVAGRKSGMRDRVLCFDEF